MIYLSSLGDRYSIDRIISRFKKADEVLRFDGITVAIKHMGPNISGMLYLPTGQEIGNFSLSKHIHTHPYWDYVDIPQGPQITWVNVYKPYRGKGISHSVYEGLVSHFKALYSDHSQTKGGASIWLSLAQRNKVDIYQVHWRKPDWKISLVEKEDRTPNISNWKDSNDTQTILLAVPKNSQIKGFEISHVEENIQLSFTK